MLAQFEGMDFKTVYMPYVNTLDKAEELVARLREITAADGVRPIVFATFPEPDINELFIKSDYCLYIELFDTFVKAGDEIADLYEKHEFKITKRFVEITADFPLRQ